MRLFSFFITVVLVIGSGFSNAQGQARSWEHYKDTNSASGIDNSFAGIFIGEFKNVVVTCNGSDFDILMGLGEDIGRDSTVIVTHQFDSDRPVYAGEWSVDRELKVVFAPDYIKRSLIGPLMSKSSVLFTAYGRFSERSGEFRLSGSSSAISSLECIPSSQEIEERKFDDRAEYCGNIRVLAESVMDIRQSGANLTEARQAILGNSSGVLSDAGIKLASDAYREKKYDTERAQGVAIDNFGVKWYMACRRDEYSFRSLFF